MKLTHILCVGIKNAALQQQCSAHGYLLVDAPSVDACAQIDQTCGLMLVHQDIFCAMPTPSMEQLYFLNNTIPVVVLISDPDLLTGALAENLRQGTLEYVYEKEIASGLIISRIDRLYLYAQLNRNIQAVQRTLGDQRTLKQELSMREEVLEHERRLNADLVASITIGLLILDTDGQIILINEHARGLLKIAANDLISVSYFSVIPPEIRTEVADMISSVQANPVLYKCKKLLFKEKILEISCYRMVDYQKKSNGILLLLQDITEQEALSLQLYQAEKLATMGTMLSGIAHELRNPLAIMSARLQRLRMQAQSDAAQTDKNLSSIETQVQRCATLIDTLLNFARQTAAKTGYHSLKDICEEATNYAAYQSSFLSVSLVRDYGEALFVFGDRSRFVQVLLNIINNALDAMNGKGTLTIKTWRHGHSTVFIEINDTGPGIDPQIQKKIFDPFFTTKDPGKGTGLGLTIAHKIVIESKGEIGLLSEPGSTSFIIKLPSTKEFSNA